MTLRFEHAGRNPSRWLALLLGIALFATLPVLQAATGEPLGAVPVAGSDDGRRTAASSGEQHAMDMTLLARGEDAFGLLAGQDGPLWSGTAWHLLVQQSGLPSLSAAGLLGGLVLVALAALLGMPLRRRMLRWCAVQRHDAFPHTFRLCAALGRYAPHLLAALAAALLAQLQLCASPAALPCKLLLLLPLLFAGWALLYFLFGGHAVPGGEIGIAPHSARGIGRSLRLVLLIAGIGFLAFDGGMLEGMSQAARLLAQDLFVLLLVLPLLWASRHLRRLLEKRGVRGVNGVVVLLLLGILIVELAGYRNLAYWVLRVALGTSLLLFLSWVLALLLREFFDGLRMGRMWWQKGLRRLFGYGVDEAMPWLGWIYLPCAATLWLAAFYLILLIWGVSPEAINRLSGYVVNGFHVGSLQIIPLRIAVAIVVFALLLAASSWFRRRLGDKWLERRHIERGSREALVTLSGYVGVALAILVALGVAGVQFTSLAIIAGALSVGIGFGLQNIVNNFVSGLILLFERPIKTGDWIMVGNTEGYVKHISIRSTVIQTFDRADVIVPNSELISGQVTNWMLYDPCGRIRIPVGVAYGSDTQKVKAILLGIAASHPRVITDGSFAEPKVLFLGFGDSSLNFELRAFIHNIDERLQVLSDINFEIDAAFRREGIEIPFPQRDLHVRSWQSPPEG